MYCIYLRKKEQVGEEHIEMDKQKADSTLRLEPNVRLNLMTPRSRPKQKSRVRGLND